MFFAMPVGSTSNNANSINIPAIALKHAHLHILLPMLLDVLNQSIQILRGRGEVIVQITLVE